MESQPNAGVENHNGHQTNHNEHQTNHNEETISHPYDFIPEAPKEMKPIVGLVEESFYWPKMRRDVSKHVEMCTKYWSVYTQISRSGELLIVQVGQFANCLIDARNELQHKSFNASLQ